jgi:hypothetical protein
VPVEGVRRPAWAEISASAIAHNVRALKEVMGATLLCAVVKANGYGHGALLAAKAALDGGADALAVAIVDEGIELREGGYSPRSRRTRFMMRSAIHSPSPSGHWPAPEPRWRARNSWVVCTACT